MLQPVEAKPAAPKGPVSNPISGEVGAAAMVQVYQVWLDLLFQTPSAGRWVLQLEMSEFFQTRMGQVSNPISGEVGAETPSAEVVFLDEIFKFQTPSAGRWVLQLAGH